MPDFPFAAIVGQETLKRALLLSVIQPSVGGVLIRGTKGVAKSTAVRALAGLLPPIQVVAGCPFQRRPGESIPDWPMPADVPVASRPVPLVELPLGATEDRVLGSLHLEKALRGERAFEPGLLASANRGILFIDEVNLLPDHLVDILLDASASGQHRVEREGLSLCHPAWFVLIGTMNPEEGDLRPQLLDRFGLVVDVADLAQPAERAEAVRRRLAFEANPERFTAQWRAAEAAEGERIIRARQLLPEVHVGDAILQSITERCLAAGVEGLRADLTMCRSAAAWAAYQGRAEVEPEDVEAVAELALAHRRTNPPEPPDQGSGVRNQGSGVRNQGSEKQPFDGTSPRHPVTLSPPQLFPSAGLFTPRVQPPSLTLARSHLPGRWRRGRSLCCGAANGSVRIHEEGAAVAWSATIRAAAPWQRDRKRQGDDQPLILDGSDLRGRPRRGPAGCLLLFLIDASGSMAAWRRMRETKTAILALLVQAYQRRDRVALLAFHDRTTDLVLPPTRGLRAARQALERLPVGGTTPLAHGLASARRLIRRERRRQPQQPIWTIILTDGRANVGLNGDGTAWQDALTQARFMVSLDADYLVVDTETGWPRFARAVELARALGASCLPLNEVLGRPRIDHWRQAV